MNVIVTGAAGFIGSHLCEAMLARGDIVHGIDNLDSYYDPGLKERNIASTSFFPNYRCHRATVDAIQRFGILEGADAIVHLAGRPGVRDDSPEELTARLSSNVSQTDMLYRRLTTGRFHGRIVHVSSSAVYGDTNSLPVRESAPCNPISTYGISKLAGEHLARVRSRGQDWSLVTVRPFTVYGPRQRPDMVVTKWMRALQQGQPLTMYGDGHSMRDMTYVADVVDALLRLVDAPSDAVRDRVFNVAGWDCVYLDDLLARIEAVSGLKAVVEREPALAHEMRSTYADNTAIRDAVGWEPKTGLDTGLKAQWEWACTA